MDVQDTFHYVERYQKVRLSLFYKREALTVYEKLGLAFLMACVTALSAQIRILLPFTPVPVTMQVLAVMLSGVLLGRTFGGLSQTMYLGMGAFGLPVFSGFQGGIGMLTGVTAGYLVGFVLAAFLIGWVVDRRAASRKIVPLFALFTAGMAIIYLCGASWLAMVLGLTFYEAFVLGVLPFIAADLFKIGIAAGIGTMALPKEPYQNKSN